jgi:hypothetical protein
MKGYICFAAGIFISFTGIAATGKIIFLEGTVGKYKSGMTLRVDPSGKNISGFYQYDGKKSWLQLGGVSYDGEIFNLEERPYHLNEPADQPTGKFSGRLLKDNSFSGIWESADKKTLLDFSFHMGSIVEGMSFISGEIKKDTVYENNIGVSADIGFLKSNAGNSAVGFLLDTFIYHRLFYHDMFADSLQPVFPDYSAIPTNFINSHLNSEFQWDWNAGCDVEWEGHGILCLSNGSWEYSGGAHGNGYEEYNCFDLRSGKRLTTDDIFVKGYEEPLRLKAVKHLSQDPDFISRDSLKLNGNFFLTPEGIGFFYNSYEITAYVNGTPVTFIPWKEISEWIDPEGPMGWVKR